MKKTLTLLLLVFASFAMQAQKEQYTYDAAGNRKLRNVCTACRQVHKAPSVSQKATLAQPQDIQLAMKEGERLYYFNLNMSLNPSCL
ncbi:MAG: hypothetical protein JST67_05725 [Bacteroidetes bacterium]|nr:hypothetical protein [Bacteroidota bacterium]